MFQINTQKQEINKSSVRGYNADIIHIKGYNFTPVSYRKVNARGKLSLVLQPSNGETFTIGTKVYTLQTSLTNFDGNIKIGATLAETQANIVAAINLTGNPGTQYALATRVNTQVYANNFSGNDCIIVAKLAGISGNSIATTETMAGAGNQFDGSTLGTYLAGAEYTPSDLMYAPWQSYRGSNSEKFEPSNVYHDWVRRGVRRYNPYWNASDFYKIVIPNSYGSKIVKVDALGMMIAKKTNTALSTAISANGNTQIYKVIEINTDKGFALYYSGGDSKLFGVAFTIAADGTITAGTPVAINNTNCNEAESDVIKIGTDKVLVGYKDSLATNFPKTAVVTISGVTCTVASGVQIVATATTDIKMCPLNTDKALIAFNHTSLYACSISVTTPSYGTVQTVTGATCMSLVQNGTDKAQLAYAKSSANYVNAVTVATLAITLGTELRITNGQPAGAWNQHKLVQITTDKLAYFTDSQDSAQMLNVDSYFLTVSGTVTTIAHSSYSGYGVDSDVYAELIAADKILLVKATERGCIVEVDSTNNRLRSRAGDEMPYIYQSGSNRYDGAPGYNGGGNERWGKIGSNIITINQKSSPTQYLDYAVFPVSIAIDVYLEDELVGTYTFDSPSICAPFELGFDVNDYTANIKLKNPNAYQMIVLPEYEGYCGRLTLE